MTIRSDHAVIKMFRNYAKGALEHYNEHGVVRTERLDAATYQLQFFLREAPRTLEFVHDAVRFIVFDLGADNALEVGRGFEEEYSPTPGAGATVTA